MDLRDLRKYKSNLEKQLKWVNAEIQKKYRQPPYVKNK